MSNQVLIFAPHGRDAAVAAKLLGRNSITAEICSDHLDLIRRLNEGVGAVLLTEEALPSPKVASLAAWVDNQPNWSDIPFVVLANGSRAPRSIAATKRLADLGNVVLLERPVHADALVEAVRSSLKARNRQYQVRDATVLQAAQNRVLELAVAQAPLRATLEAILREVERLSTTGAICSILLLDEGGTHLRHGAAPSLPSAYNVQIDGMRVGPAMGSCGAAVHRNEPVFVNDISSDPLWKDFRHWALQCDLRACWSFPIHSVQGDVLGTFALYHREPLKPESKHLAIVDFVVRTAGIVIARSRTENNLRASEARYRQIVEGVDDFAIVTLDAAGFITSWNSGAAKILGYSVVEAVGKPGSLFFTIDDRADDAPRREMALAAKEGSAINERWHLKKDGGLFWGSGLTMPLADGDDGYVKIFCDRTKEHEAERAIRESESRLRFFGRLEDQLFKAETGSGAMQAAAQLLGRKLEASRCAYADVDYDSDRFWIRNDYATSGIGSTIGTYSLNLFGPRAATGLRRGKTLILNDIRNELGSGHGLEMFHAIGINAIVCCPLIKDGRLAAMMAVHQVEARIWTDSEISLVREVAERCWAHVQRVGAEARLSESEERLRLAVESAEIGFWDVDVVNDRLIWPARTKAMFGISADVPVSMDDFYKGLHPDDREVTVAAFNAAADPDVRALYEVDYRTIGKEDGVERWVAAKGRGIFDMSGKCVRLAGTALEITARKQAEEALRDLNATLEARVSQAIEEREEAHEALRQSQKMEAMGQLTGGVAHDFNNLLTPIVGVLDMLQRKGIGGEREQRLIAGAGQSAERARVLVQRLLAFARRQPLQSVAVDIAKLVSGMGDLIESTTGPQIKIVVEVPEYLPAARADPNQLEMALLNLAVNARDAMPSGGTLKISATAESVRSGHRSRLTAGSYVCLSVADTGTGMDEATLARAIEPFFSTKGIGKGTGLGLSMVHGLASQLGGGLTIQSMLKQGTNVELWLPVSGDAVSQASMSDGSVSKNNHRGIALLVDDEEFVRMSTADMLFDLGFMVIEANSAEEAVSVLEAGHTIDIMVTDHLMPGMNGTQLAQRVKLMQPKLPVLLVSGYAEPEGVDASLPRLTKPFRKDEIAATIASLLDSF